MLSAERIAVPALRRQAMRDLDSGAVTICIRLRGDQSHIGSTMPYPSSGPYTIGSGGMESSSRGHSVTVIDPGP